MLYVKVDDKKGGIERALKQLKIKFKRTRVVQEVRERSEFRKRGRIWACAFQQ